jgi:hypothetical protein
MAEGRTNAANRGVRSLLFSAGYANETHQWCTKFLLQLRRSAADRYQANSPVLRYIGVARGIRLPDTISSYKES